MPTSFVITGHKRKDLDSTLKLIDKNKLKVVGVSQESVDSNINIYFTGPADRIRKLKKVM